MRFLSEKVAVLKAREERAGGQEPLGHRVDKPTSRFGGFAAVSRPQIKVQLSAAREPRGQTETGRSIQHPRP